MGALLAFPRPFAKRAPQMSDGLPPFLRLTLRTLTPVEPNGPLMAHVHDADTNELLKVDRVKAVDSWLRDNGYEWAVGLSGIYRKKKVGNG